MAGIRGEPKWASFPDMDFSPRPPGYNSPTKRLEFDDTAGKLLLRAKDVCHYLLPAGRQRGDEFEVGGLTGDGGKSLKVNTRQGLWKDFESGDGGHDLIALWAGVKGIRMVEAKQEAERWLGIEERKTPAVTVPLAPRTEPRVDITKDWIKSKPWDYFDADGVHFGSVYRFDDPAGKQRKEFRPWNGKEWKAPEGIRPLYNLPRVIAAPLDALIVLVEGEKCADAITQLGDSRVVGCSSWGGAAAASKTDWSPLSRRHVLRWPDGDHPKTNSDGTPKEVAREVWLRTTGEHIAAVGPASLRDVPVPVGKPDGWDCADATPDERRSLIAAAMADVVADVPAPRVRLADMTADKLFAKVPPEQEWLVHSVIPFGRGGVFAAPGDTGKGMLLVDLACKVATHETPGMDASVFPTALGHRIARRGAVVLLSAEDDTDELNRRVRALHPDMPIEAKRRLHILPYPDMMNRAPTYMVGDANKVDATVEFIEVRKELLGMTGLALVIMDPVSAFAGVDLTSASTSQQVGNALDKLAKDLGCTVIGSHHLTKGDRRYPIATAADARHAIGGAGQLLNALRFAYALWAPGETKERDVLARMGRDHVNNAVYMGAVVKANANSDRHIQTYARNLQTGLLEIVPASYLSNEPLKPGDVPYDIADMLVRSIRWFGDQNKLPVGDWICETARSREGKATNTGKWMKLMPEMWRKFRTKDHNGKSRTEILEALIESGRVKQMDGKEGFLYTQGDEWDTGIRRPAENIRIGPMPTPVDLSKDSA